MLDDGEVDQDGDAAVDQMQASQSTIATVADNAAKTEKFGKTDDAGAEKRRGGNDGVIDADDEDEDSKQEESSSNLMFHPPAAHEEHSAGDSVKSDQLEQDCQIAEIDAGIAAEMKYA